MNISEDDRKLFAEAKIKPCDLDDVRIELEADQLAAALMTSEKFIRDVLPPEEAEEFLHPAIDTLDEALDLIEAYRRSDVALRSTIRQLVADAEPLHMACERWLLRAQRAENLVRCQWFMLGGMALVATWFAWKVLSE